MEIEEHDAMQAIFCREFGEFFVVYHMAKDCASIHKETFEVQQEAFTRANYLLR